MLWVKQMNSFGYPLRMDHLKIMVSVLINPRSAA
jgi:hypothetical protein